MRNNEYCEAVDVQGVMIACPSCNTPAMRSKFCCDTKVCSRCHSEFSIFCNGNIYSIVLHKSGENSNVDKDIMAEWITESLKRLMKLKTKYCL